jgi:DNA polymerase I-like protein with 3'-5' exonuclease and polymerase domains
MIYKQGSIQELVEALDPTQPVYFDTETSKLGSQIRLIQVYQEHWNQVLLFDTLNTSALILWTVVQPYHLVGHNLTYDMGCFNKDLPVGTFTMPEQWDDTFYLSRLTNPEWQEYSLDKALTKVIGYDPYSKEGLNKKQLQLSFERLKVKDQYIEGPEGLRVLTDEQFLYASIDVYELPKLWHAVKFKVDDFVYILDKLTIEHIQTDTKGLSIDLDKLTTLETKDMLDIAAIKKQLPLGFNVNSYLQVRKALGTIMSSNEEALSMIQFRPTGLTDMPLRTTMTNGKFPAALLAGIKNKTIRVFIKEFGNETPVDSYLDLPKSPKMLVYYIETNYVHSQAVIDKAKLINEQRKALKRLNFADRARKAYTVDSDGIPRIKGTFSPHAINGRIQVDNENLSQYPRTMKSMWGHKQGNGRKLIYSDFAQVELRIICAALPEMNMYKSLKEGIDLHTFVGNNLNLTPEDLAQLPAGISPRFIAKQCNFLLLYGGGISNFQRTVCKLGGVWFDTDIATKITTNWKDIFSDIKLWHKKNGASKSMLDKTVSGRPYKAGTVTDLNNIKVSGTGSEIFKLWLHYIDKYIITKYPSTYIVNRVHDSVIIDVPDDEKLYKEISNKIALCAQAAWFEIIQNAELVDVPMPVDVLVGSNWEDLEYGREALIDYSYTLDGMYMYGKDLEEELNG